MRGAASACLQPHTCMTQDIALVAFALAHGADNTLDKVEVDEIARRLEKWRNEPSDPTTLAAMKNALDRYAGRAENGDVDEAIERLGARLSQEERADLLTDLVAIARADAVMDPGEKDFLKKVRHAWGLEG